MTYSTPAIILRRRDIGEWDRLYTAYTRERGKLTLIGKGTRRPKAKLAAHLEPYAEVDLVIANGKAIDRITFARTIQSGAAIATSYERAHTAAYIAECVDALTKEHHRDPAIYDLLRDALRTVAESSTTPLLHHSTTPPLHYSSLTAPFTLRLLSLLGYAPQLDRCIECRIALPNGPVTGLPLRGGLTCNPCAMSVRDGISLSEADRQQLTDAVASFRPFAVNSDVEAFARVMLEAHLWQPLRTLLPGSELTRERDQVRIAAS